MQSTLGEDRTENSEQFHIRYRALELIDETQFIVHDANKSFPRWVCSFIGWRPSMLDFAEAFGLTDGGWQVTRRRQLSSKIHRTSCLTSVVHERRSHALPVLLPIRPGDCPIGPDSAQRSVGQRFGERRVSSRNLRQM